MAKIKKKGEAGQARNYITRTQAVRKLQITLPDFRRLCIFKGIYPREPRNLKKANKSATHSTTFYYTKDIQYLLHEPLLAKFREQKALSKKIARSLGRNEVQDAARLEKYGMPKIKLDHIVRERYPTFIDALRDLDDALSLLFLFANLPSTATVPPKAISRCQRLCHEFEHYLIATNSLRKSFLSIKGIYYQATIQGEDIMWLVPYRFVQRVTQDVDYRIMGTFVEFYCTLLGFINYRLYTSIGLVYPPRFDTKSDEKGAELAAFTLEGKQVAGNLEDAQSTKAVTNGHAKESNSAEVEKELAKIAQSETNADEPQQEETLTHEAAEQQGMDKFEIAAPEGDVLEQPQMDSSQARQLCADMVVFISREAPRHPVEFLLRAFGCKRVGWDEMLGEGAFTSNERDPQITHQIVDRPPTAVSSQTLPETNGEPNANSQQVLAGYIVPGRIYVQPQWIWDCVNEGKLLRTDIYAPGATLPPHLSPWIKPKKGQYDPRATLEEQEAEGEAEDAAIADAEIEALQGEDERLAIEDNKDSDSEEDGVEHEHGMQVALDDEGSASEMESDQEMDEADDFSGFNDTSIALKDDDDDDVSPDLANEDADKKSNDDEDQADLQAEALGLSYTTDPSISISKPNAHPSYSANPSDPQHKQTLQRQRQRQLEKQREEEDLTRRKMMTSNKKRKLYEKMAKSNERKDDEAARLRAKRRKIEKRGGQEKVE